MKAISEIIEIGMENRQNFLGDKILDKMQLNMPYYHDTTDMTIGNSFAWSTSVEFLSYMIFTGDTTYGKVKSVIVSLLVDSTIKFIKIYDPVDETLIDIDILCENTITELLHSQDSTPTIGNTYYRILTTIGHDIETNTTTISDESVEEFNVVTVEDGDYVVAISINKPMNERNKSFMKVFANGLIMYKRKNTDYGDSAYNTLKLCGETSGYSRITDKWMRLTSLMLNNKSEVDSESIEDTMLDMMNYSAIILSWVSDGRPRLTSADELIDSMGK